MSQRRLLFAVPAMFFFSLFFLEYTLNTLPAASVRSGGVIGIQTSASQTPSPFIEQNFATPAAVSSRHRSVTVTRVVDGDTIKIDTGEIVRYIGIDAPETVDPKKPDGCFGPEASRKNSELVLGKTVFLEHDISPSDRYGRLLAYVWMGEKMVNEILVRDGYAVAHAYPPDVRYQSVIQNAELTARSERKGLWGTVCIPSSPTQ